MSNIKERAAMENACRMAVEAISNIRTVASLGQEPHVLSRFYNEIEKVEQLCRQKMKFRGIVFALGQAAPAFGYAVSLYYGGMLVANDGLEYKNVIK